MASAKLYRVVSPFVLYRKGSREHYNPGDGVFSADHHAVKANPESFREVDVQGVEQATAAPGEKRTAAVPAAKAAKK